MDYLLRTGALCEADLMTFKPGVCNRLDRNTSGLILSGKTLSGLQELSRMLSERTVHKYYLTIVVGEIKEKKHIDGYLYKKEQHNTVEIYSTEEFAEVTADRTDPHAKEIAQHASYIRTEYEPLCENGQYTLLKVQLITGKSHQIRAHLAHIGHPIVGDGKYGYRKTNEAFRRMHVNSQLLHAWKLCFPKQCNLPALSGRELVAPVPKEFCKVAAVLNLKLPETESDLHV